MAMKYLHHFLSASLLFHWLCVFPQTTDSARRGNLVRDSSQSGNLVRDSSQRGDPIRDSAFSLAETIFSRPSFLFETLQADIPADMQLILIRMNNAISTNKEWFTKYRSKYGGGGQSLPYDEHFGISRNEYRKVQHMESQPPQLVVADSQKVAVQSDNGLIQFTSDGNPHFLDYLLLDIRHQWLMYGGDTLPFKGAVTTQPTNPYGQWQGYTWRLERTDLTATLAAGKPTARVIEVDLGLPQQPGKAYIRIEYQDMKAGVTTANLELIGYIR